MPEPRHQDRSFEQLWLKHAAELEQRIRQRYPLDVEVAEIVQCTAQSGQRNFIQYDPARPFLSWLLGHARNHVRELFRARRRSRARPLCPEALQVLVEETQRIEETSAEVLDSLEVCLETLSPAEREVLRSRYWDEDTLPTIAERLHKSHDAVKQLSKRAFDKVRNCVLRRLGYPLSEVLA